MKSGLTGGAATGLGVNYQSLYAVHLALKLISSLIRDSPIHRPILVIEPRILSGQSLTRWDIRRIATDEIAMEAKAKATKPDLIELLERCRDDADSGRKTRYELVYAECNVGFLRAIKKFIRIANEATGAEEFGALCGLETDGDLQEVLDHLGSAAFVVGQRLTLKHFPEQVLHDAIDNQSRFLVPPSHRKQLQDSLYSRFVNAMKERTPFFIPELLTSLKKEGIDFVDPGTILPTDIDPALHSALFLMQRCEIGLPIDVLVQCTDRSASTLAEMFQETQACAVNQDGVCTPNPLPAPLDHAGAEHVLSEGLSAVIEYIKANNTNQTGLQQVNNAISLVRECSTANPSAATIAFDPIQKLLKCSGQKRRVLEVAQITVDSARSVSPPTEAVRRAEAQALICGFSWVYQRLGRFDEAESSAAESFQIGQSLGWDRNTAFCLKCMGRLRRVRAEQESDRRRRARLLNESREHLLQAIDAFSSCTEFRADHPEVGDCYSLLARTHLLAGRTYEADQCASRARELITASAGYTDSKDYMDLLILEGELLAKQLDYPKADKKFAEALACLDPNDSEKSEIAARAYLARGINILQEKQQKEKAVAEIHKAAQIWENLNEHFYRGLARWRIIEILEEIPKRDRNKLKKVTPSVRVEMVRLVGLQRQAQSTKTLSQRAELNDAAWARLLSEAKKNDAIRHKRW